ncbi:hypothetical protein F2Q69_00007458 [Brassica cretica]|uniref:Uncharacterized protein n=1 Tax=Brassica cretica TaxID=69181 RepID=A0A8S9NYX2_BRACR|nr:hypothetical protein F2Q69_00007458 [Brassica cretica]
MAEAASENNASDVTPEGDNTMDDQQESRTEQRLSETIPRKNICSEPGAAQPVPEPKAVDSSTSCPFAYSCSTRRDEGSSDDDAAVAPGSANPRESVESASHMCQMDVQIAQTAESVKRHQRTLPGKTNNNPKECNTVALRSGRTLPVAVPKKLSAAEKGKQKEVENPQSEAVPLSDEDTEQPAETDPTPAATPVEHVPSREYTPKVPYPVPAKPSRKDREETKF